MTLPLLCGVCGLWCFMWLVSPSKNHFFSQKWPHWSYKLLIYRQWRRKKCWNGNFIFFLPETMSVCHPFLERSKVCNTPINLRSKFADSAEHIYGSNADFGPCMEGSYADFAPHMDRVSGIKQKSKIANATNFQTDFITPYFE